MARTFALIVPVQPILYRPSCSNETIQNAPKHYETHQNISLGSNGVDWVCLLRKKSRRDFVPRTFALITLVPVLHRVSCSYDNITNAPKHYETHQNKSLGSNEVDWVLRCEKSQRDCMARPCALIASVQPVLHRVLCSNETNPKCTQTV